MREADVLTHLASAVEYAAMEELEPRRLMTGFVDTPIELPAEKSLVNVTGSDAIYFESRYPTPTQQPGGIFDAATGQFHSLTIPAGLASMQGYSIASVGSKTLFAGGLDNPPHPTTHFTPFNPVYIYDRSSGQFTTATLSVARGDSTTVTVGTKAIFAGGIVVDVNDVGCSRARNRTADRAAGKNSFGTNGHSGAVAASNG